MSKTVRIRKNLLKYIHDEKRAFYRAKLTLFMEHASHVANLEKLHGSKRVVPHYTIRGNNEERLVLIPVAREGEQQWILVDILDRHQYTALARKPKNWLSNEDVSFDALAEEEPGGQVAGPLVDLVEEYDLEIEYYCGDYLILDELQKEAKYARFPLILSGAPGSWKSSTALAIFNRYEEQSGEEEKQFMYLTQSSLLADTLSKEWAKTRASSNVKVDFKTPLDLFTERGGDAAAVVGEWFFKSWYDDYCKKHPLLATEVAPATSKGKPRAKEEQAPLPESKDAYQEMRTLSGYDDLDSYQEDVGLKHSLMGDRATHGWLWDAHQAYLNYLKTTTYTDLAFYDFGSGLYDLVVVDEAQDLSRKQLRATRRLAKHNSAVYGVGDHQQLFGSERIVPFLKSVYKKEAHLDVTHIPLLASYRCHAKVIQLANAILQLKYYASGGSLGLNKQELRFVEPIDATDEGDVYWLDTEADLATLRQDLANADFIVIAPAEHLAEARALFEPKVKG